ncbi:MAG TPA: methyltransferase domain-containing protein [Opitutaceae bacterium]|nr:methyltransferase domain-containing protein [Opitutaceae bacterium]
MGIATGTFQQLLQEHRQRPFTGRLLTLGKQDIYLTAQDLSFWTAYYGVPTVGGPEFEYSAKPDFAALGRLSDREVFRRLGATLESLDASDYEGCDHVADLNSPLPPEQLRGRYDLVLDTGTFEHVFHLPNAFQFCHSLLKEGGRMVHMSPLSNYADHGFYMLSPTLYHDFYETNGWRILQMKVIRHSKAHDTEPYWTADYSPEHFNALSFGGLDGALYQTFAVVEKLPGATADRIPQQRAYRLHAWTGSAAAGPTLTGPVASHVGRRIAERLAQYANWIRPLAGTAPRIVIYGAGGHTSALLQAWRGFQLPEPDCIVQTAPPTTPTFEGLPLLAFADLPARGTPGLIVLSSQRFEAEMAAACARAFPTVPMLRFWS